MSYLSVKARLFAGFGLVVAALIAVAAMSISGLGTVRDLLVDYRGAARQSVTTASLTQTIIEARLQFMAYRVNFDPEKMKAFGALMQEFDSAATKVRDIVAGTPNEEKLNGIEKLVQNYRSGAADYERAHGEVVKTVAEYEAISAKLRKEVSELMAASVAGGDAEEAFLAGQFQESLMLSRLYTERYVADLAEADLAEGGRFRAEAATRLGVLLRSLDAPARVESGKVIDADFAAANKAIEAMVKAIGERIAIRAEVDKIGPAAMAELKALFDSALEAQNTLGPQAQATAESTVSRTLVLAGVFMVVGMAIALFLGFSISNAIGAITASMRRLASGDLTADIFGAGRKDEIGAMAGAVAVFKTNAIERQRLEAEQEAAKSAAEAEKRRMMISLADEFEAAIGGVVANVSASATQLQSSAQVLASTSEETSRQSASVAAASEEASVNVQTVATASEELAVSVSEVGKQVSESARMSDHAVAEASTTAEKIKELSVAADRIGSIVDLIQTISGQTNLLALNATIEAARAGEAGKGFAVVAAEVKNLADQTARATTEIAQQIAAIQATTAESVSAIDGISTRIRNLNAIATAIAGAVEEQGAATQEIARNVQQAAQGTTSVSGAIGEVQQAATEASGASSQVLSAAGGLSEQASRLRNELNRFLGNIRAG